MSKTNRNFKASVFTHLFRETGNEYELYNAVAPGSFPPGTPGEEPALELVVQVYNINPGHNGEVLQRSETLRDYMAFITKTRENEANGMNREEAIDKAIRDCVKEGILAEYLEKYGSEVRRGCRGTAPCFLYLIHLLA